MLLLNSALLRQTHEAFTVFADWFSHMAGIKKKKGEEEQSKERSHHLHMWSQVT